MPQTTVTLTNGRELDVSYTIEPAYPGDDPEILIDAVTVGWHDVDTTDDEDVEILTIIHREILEEMADDEAWEARHADD